jgi:FHA domain
MATCPKGHESAATDYCDECGAPIGGAASPAGGASPAAGPSGEAGPAGVARPAGVAGPASGEPCPECATPRAGRFCEVCGHDFLAVTPAERPSGGDPPAVGDPSGEAGPPVTPPPSGEAGPPTGSPAGEGGAPAGTATGTGWRVVVTADRAYYDRMRAAADPGAEDVPFPAYCPERRFGLQPPQVLIGRQSRSRGIEPDIDLTGPPADPAVSHSHAMLVAQAAGGWAVVDLGSANGTYLNDGDTAIAENTPVPVADGDRIHVGAWSTLTLRAN